MSNKTGRNDPCPCGSGLKYKKCCLKGGKVKRLDHLKKMYARRFNIRFKEKRDIEGIKKAGRLVLATLELVESEIRTGITTDAINTMVHTFTTKHNAIPAPLNYRGFPKSVCVSVNDVVCHGIPGERVLQDGDIVNVDVTTILDGYYADANKTFCLGTPGPEAQKIVKVARESLKRGMSVVLPGGTTGDIGGAIQEYAEAAGCAVVREYTGHGVGFQFHEPPQILHYGRKGEGFVLVPGMVFTVEPMINLGKRDIRLLDDKWTVVTADGSLSAQFEQTVLVTDNGCESLTPYDL